MFLAKFLRDYRTWRRYRASVRELSKLDDHTLADIGISRSEIEAIAWRSAGV